jgi:hypothetical protein
MMKHKRMRIHIAGGEIFLLSIFFLRSTIITASVRLISFRNMYAQRVKNLLVTELLGSSD